MKNCKSLNKKLNKTSDNPDDIIGLYFIHKKAPLEQQSYCFHRLSSTLPDK